MDYEAEVSAFLAQKENFRLALEIADHLEKAKSKVQVAFWKDCERRLLQRLSASTQAESWKTGMPFNDGDSVPATGEPLYLVPSEIDPYAGGTRVVYYGFGTYQYSTEYGVFTCVRLDTDEGWQTFKSKELARLSDMLKEEGHKPSELSVGWRSLWTHAKPDPFLVGIVERPEEMAESAVEVLWKTFTQTVAQAEKATAAIRKMRRPHPAT